MPTKNSNRSSMPAGVNSPNGTTIVPSRRSPRVPTTVKSINQTPQSSKSLNLSSTPHSASSFNFRFYNQNTPSTTEQSRNSSPDLPSTRHRTFQTRPSRLSTVYPSTLDTPTSRQTTRQARRTSTLETPHSHFADDEFSETFESTGWTYDQYTGGLDFDKSMARATSPSASSGTTRRSTRERKPTLKALESEQTQQRQKVPRRKKTQTAAASTTAPIQASTVQPAPAKAPAKRARAEDPGLPSRKKARTTAQSDAIPTEATPAETSVSKNTRAKPESQKKVPAKPAQLDAIPPQVALVDDSATAGNKATKKRARVETPTLPPRKKARTTAQDETIPGEAAQVKASMPVDTRGKKDSGMKAPAKRTRAVSPVLPLRRKTEITARGEPTPAENVPVKVPVPKKTLVEKSSNKDTPPNPAQVDTPSPAKIAPTSAPAPPPIAQPANTPAPIKPATRATAKRRPAKAKKTKKAPKTPKPAKPPKPPLLKLELSVGEAGSRLFKCASEALGPDFELPSDPEKVIADARRSFEQSLARAQEESAARAQEESASRAREESAASVHKKNVAHAQEDDRRTRDDASGIKKYKKSSPPRLESSGWTLAGRTNDNGEKLVVTPPNTSPYRPPNTYGDEALSQPPIYSRSELDVEKDNALGFPPLIGDRNIPSTAAAQFQPEDVTDEQARVKARGNTRQKNDSGRAGSTQSGKKARARKPRETKAAKGETKVAVPSPGAGKSKPAQRRPARANKAAAVKPESEEAPVEETDRPKIRIRLTLKPKAPAEEAPPTATTSVPAPAAPTRGKAANPSVPRGKKRAIDLTSEVEPANEAPSKRARRPRN